MSNLMVLLARVARKKLQFVAGSSSRPGEDVLPECLQALLRGEAEMAETEKILEAPEHRIMIVAGPR